MNTLFSEDYPITTMRAGAKFSECRKFRYALWRIWDDKLPKVMFIGINPSKADESEPDNTITKVCKIAKNNGYGSIFC